VDYKLIIQRIVSHTPPLEIHEMGKVEGRGILLK
jgi:hypothetical protein